jgi:hypothetical protein
MGGTSKTRPFWHNSGTICLERWKHGAVGDCQSSISVARLMLTKLMTEHQRRGSGMWGCSWCFTSGSCFNSTVAHHEAMPGRSVG